MHGAVVAGLWGLAAGSSLLIGAAVGLWARASRRTIGLVMALGAGVLMSSLAFELMEEAYAAGGLGYAAIGLAAGALSYFLADQLVARHAQHRKRSQGQQAGATASALVIGALMDGIPESAAIGVTLLGGGRVSAVMVVAVFLSNFPEAMSAAAGMKKAGHSPRFILGLWTGVVVVSALASALGYVCLGDASGGLLGALQAFAAGAILTMLASTMMPEAYEEGGALVGLMTALGFLASFALSMLDRGLTRFQDPIGQRALGVCCSTRSRDSAGPARSTRRSLGARTVFGPGLDR